tara:strand:- start:565 stop:681 length:117 start_codon:yes stop_codon:yes gene_type:complete
MAATTDAIEIIAVTHAIIFNMFIVSPLIESALTDLILL